MRSLDFTSWQTLLSTLFGLALISLIGVGIRLLVMQSVQRRRERENRQINERLRTLIAAYKTLGGSFTGDLAVSPVHWRDVRLLADRATSRAGAASTDHMAPPAALSFQENEETLSYDRSRRIRDAVEASLSDIILLGTEEQVRLAAQAATELASGRAARTDALVVSLRDFIRQVLDLDPVPANLSIPKQGPARPAATRAGGKGDGGKGDGDKDGAKRGGGQGLGGEAAVGMGLGAGSGLGGKPAADEDTEVHREAE